MRAKTATANRLVDVFDRHLAQLSPAERQRKLARFMRGPDVEDVQSK